MITFVFHPQENRFPVTLDEYLEECSLELEDKTVIPRPASRKILLDNVPCKITPRSPSLLALKPLRNSVPLYRSDLNRYSILWYAGKQKDSDVYGVVRTFYTRETGGRITALFIDGIWYTDLERDENGNVLIFVARGTHVLCSRPDRQVLTTPSSLWYRSTSARSSIRWTPAIEDEPLFASVGTWGTETDAVVVGIVEPDVILMIVILITVLLFSAVVAIKLTPAEKIHRHTLTRTSV